MKTNRLFGFILASMAALLLAGCDPKEEKLPGYDTATFEAAMASVSDYAATVNITVTGNDESPWYGFLSDDVTSDVEDVISSFVSGLNVNKNILKKGNATVDLSDLAAGKPYRYIVTGLTPAGFTYGTPAVAEFKTTGDFVYTSLTRDENITIELGYNADSTKSVISIKGASGYYDFDYMILDDCAELYETVPEYVFATIDSVKAHETNLASRLKSGDADYEVELLEANTDYIAIVYSLTENYNSAGTYAAAGLNRVTVTPVPRAFEDWAGIWSLPRGEETDTLIIRPNKDGKTYTVSGFQSFGLDLQAQYNDDGTMSLIEDADMYTDEDGYVYGAYGLFNPDGVSDINDCALLGIGLPVLRFTEWDNGVISIGPEEVDLSKYGLGVYPTVGMGFFAALGDKIYSFNGLEPLSLLDGDVPLTWLDEAPPMYSDDLLRFCGTFDVPGKSGKFCSVTFAVDEEADGEALLMTGWDKSEFTSPVTFVPDLQVAYIPAGITLADSVVFNKTKIGQAVLLACVRYGGSLHPVAAKNGPYVAGVVSYLGEQDLEIHGGKIAIDTDSNDIPEYYDVETINLYYVDYAEGKFTKAQKSSPALPLVLTPSADEGAAAALSTSGVTYEEVDPADILYAYPVQGDINNPAFHPQKSLRPRRNSVKF